MTSVIGIPVSPAAGVVLPAPLAATNDDPSQWTLAVDGTIGSDPVKFDLHMPESVAVAGYKVLGLFGSGTQRAVATLRSGDWERIPLTGSYFIDGAKKLALREVARTRDELVEGALSAVAARKWAQPASGFLAEGLFKSGREKEASNLFSKLANATADTRQKFDLRLKAAIAAERYAKHLEGTSDYEKLAGAQWAAGQLYDRVEEDAKVVSEAIASAFIAACEPNISFDEHATLLQLAAAKTYERGGLEYEASDAFSHLFRKAAKSGDSEMALSYMNSAIAAGIRWADGAKNAATKMAADAKVVTHRHILGMYLMGEKRWDEAAAEFEKVCAFFAQVGIDKENSLANAAVLNWTECLSMSGKPEEAVHKLEPAMEMWGLAVTDDKVVTTDDPSFWNILYHYWTAKLLVKMDRHLRAADSFTRMDTLYHIAEKPLGRAMARALQAEAYRRGGGVSMARESAIASAFAGDLYFGEATRQERAGKKEDDRILMSQARDNLDEAARQYVLAAGDLRTTNEHKRELAEALKKAGDASYKLSRFGDAARYYKEAVNVYAVSRDEKASAAAQKKLISVLNAWFSHLIKTGDKRAAYSVGLRLQSEAGCERKDVHRKLIRLAAVIDQHGIPA